MSANSQTIFLPAAGDRPAEPAPYLLTEDELVRLLRLDNSDPYQALYRYRQKGWLKAVQVGNHVRYTLPDAMQFIEKTKEVNPR